MGPRGPVCRLFLFAAVINENVGPSDQTRSEVMEWLRAANRDPEWLSAVDAADWHRYHRPIAERFLKWTKESGFECQLAEVVADEKTYFETRWTFHGSSFVGFKQPARQDNQDDALLMGCAALLANQWCRDRLPP